jgi:hypothetical protein
MERSNFPINNVGKNTDAGRYKHKNKFYVIPVKGKTISFLGYRRIFKQDIRNTSHKENVG